MNTPDDQYADDERPATDEEMQEALAEYMADQGNSYGDWLMSRRADLLICNGDDLIRHMEAETDYDEFLMEKHNGGV